jgi:hypothetical protein
MTQDREGVERELRLAGLADEALVLDLDVKKVRVTNYSI